MKILEIQDRPVICVTGPMAAGKNTVAAILEERGFVSADADKIVHRCAEDAKEEILAEFEEEAKREEISLLRPDGTLDRRALGRLVFADKERLARQEAIIHPLVCRRLEEFMSAHPDAPVALNATVLYKTALIKKCSWILFVDAPMIVRFLRIIKRDNMPPAQIYARFFAQKNIFTQYQNTDADIYKVWNLGSIQSLRRKVDRFLTDCLIYRG